MSNVMISFIASLGFAGWVYSKIQRKTGGNTSNSLVVAGGAALVLFIALLMILNMLSGSTN